MASAGLPVGRQVAGAMAMVVGLPALTALLVHDRDLLPLATPMLLMLTLVVIGALIGGLRVGLPAAVAGAFLLNWFFTDPYGTLLVHRSDQLLVLVVYLTVSVAVSLVVGVGARRAAEATRAKAEANALSALAGVALAELETLPRILEQVRAIFNVREVALLERQGHTWIPVETVHGSSLPTPGEAELRLEVSPNLALNVRGRELLGQDQKVLRSFAQAAATALEARRLATQAATAADLEAADRMRIALLAAVGHDLRTPLTAVKAAVSSLRQNDIAWSRDETDDLLETIEDSADQLQYLVTNLLDASRLQAGVVSATIQAAPLDEVIDRALVTVPNPSRVSVLIPESLPQIMVDVGLAERVLANLLNNALRHAPPDSLVTVQASVRVGHVVCQVVDHGTGVPESEWQRMFAPFQHFDDRQSGGIGLGLAVARGFTEAMGGYLEPATTPGGGLTMRLVLPAANPAGP